ncbi:MULTISPECIES: pyridoxal phosphate-dependent aminotransferase [unclassified Guyparkeria]|uniref:pyridoxal phosphate-dependent aminotransferase n=1 Tax=unclassified Guyparkeria TaxID=2626246 RepID=UPI0007336434|nr:MULTISPECIES: pyridoxal phosphate-dependent aminotransferase [unclassified Guyparkeria]KTG17196.1 aspartate aminotransferase [Guyparkeria sp. XI15]OAE87166.1 aspartate aminotransferase [Guyparkeria sp. WRN-7]
MNLSDRVRRVRPSPTLAVTAKAAELRAAGRDIISLGAGEPDFDTPKHIGEAGIQAIRDGFTRYTAVEGIVELRQAIADKLKADQGLEYGLDQIIVSTGGKQSIFNLCQALLNPGDEAIVTAPYWVSYPDMVRLAGGEPVIVSASQDQGFKVTPRQLAAAITDKTRLVMLNSPSNPTGVAYTREDWAQLADVLRDHPEIVIATDDMYEKILWADEPFSNIAMVAPDLAPRTVVLNGVSKAYAMTGWRIGYAAGPADLIKAMKVIQSQSTSGACSIAQKAACEAIAGDQSEIDAMVAAFRERHDYVVEALNALPGVTCLPGQGAFYSFPDVSAAMAALGIDDDVAFSEHLLEKAGVAVVPGSAFGAPGHVRLSYATSLDALREAIGRIEAVLPTA